MVFFEFPLNEKLLWIISDNIVLESTRSTGVTSGWALWPWCLEQNSKSNSWPGPQSKYDNKIEQQTNMTKQVNTSWVWVSFVFEQMQMLWAKMLIKLKTKVWCKILIGQSKS